MGLPRLTIASQTLKDFIGLTSTEQAIIHYLLTKRSMNIQPTRPTVYLSFQDIAEAIGRKESTVQKTVTILRQKEWIKECGYLPHRKGERRKYRWTIDKVIKDLVETYASPAENAPIEESIYIHEDTEWRLGGAFGYQYRSQGSRLWRDSSNVPERIIDFFSS